MFATLSVTLPSLFEGGALVAKHSEKEIRFDVATKARFESFFAFHYSDVEDRVETVTDGFRLAMVYSMCWTQKSNLLPAASLLDDKKHRIARAITALFHHDDKTTDDDVQKDDDDERDVLIFYLSHLYTEDALTTRGLESLKDADKRLVKTLQSATPDLVFRLTRVEQRAQQTGYDDGDGDGFEMQDETMDDDPTFDAWIDEDGEPDPSLQDFEINTDLDAIHVESMEVGHKVAWGDPIDEDGVEYTGNEGATREVTCEKYLLAVFPLEDHLRDAMRFHDPDTAVGLIHMLLGGGDGDVTETAAKQATMAHRTAITV